MILKIICHCTDAGRDAEGCCRPVSAASSSSFFSSVVVFRMDLAYAKKLPEEIRTVLDLNQERNFFCLVFMAEAGLKPQQGRLRMRMGWKGDFGS
ncbi:MAG: hypothetical protein HY885_06080 [Deltaproteobacteria bacterium]|nr:hypothetical protein [Deltaproteobacteria bacterium]